MLVILNHLNDILPCPQKKEFPYNLEQSLFGRELNIPKVRCWAAWGLAVGSTSVARGLCAVYTRLRKQVAAVYSSLDSQCCLPMVSCLQGPERKAAILRVAMQQLLECLERCHAVGEQQD